MTESIEYFDLRLSCCVPESPQERWRRDLKPVADRAPVETSRSLRDDVTDRSTMTGKEEESRGLVGSATEVVITRL